MDWLIHRFRLGTVNIGYAFAICLWFLLWSGIFPTSVDGLVHPDSPRQFVKGIVAISPFIAGCVGFSFVFAQALKAKRFHFALITPLGLTTVYVLVGVAASWKSPDPSTALWWAFLYLSVPCVLWFIVSRSDSLVILYRLVNLTWLLIGLATLLLFIVALLYLDLAPAIKDPSHLLKCSDGGWHHWASGLIRGTGVGRYAAITGIISFTGLWSRRWRSLASIVLIISVLLLIFTGARGAFAGFAVASVFVLVMYEGRRAIVLSGAAILIIFLLMRTTSMHTTFLEGCIFRGYPTPVAHDSSVIEKSEVIQDDSIEESEKALVMLDAPFQTIQSTPYLEDTQVQRSELPASTERPIPTDLPPASKPLATKRPISVPIPTEQPDSKSGPIAQVTVVPVPSERPTVSSREFVNLTSTEAQAVSTGAPATIPAEAVLNQIPMVPSPSATPIIITLNEISTEVPRLKSSQDLFREPSPQRESESSTVAKVTAEIPSTVGDDPSDSSSIGESEHGKITPTESVQSENRYGTFLKFTGRTAVWREAIDLLGNSPWLGFGFHADRLMLGTHMHNSFMHGLFQTGLIGIVPLMSAFIAGWILLVKLLRKLSEFDDIHRWTTLQSGAVLIFLTVRSFPESTGAFFGVDLLILGPILVYLQVLYSSSTRCVDESQCANQR